MLGTWPALYEPLNRATYAERFAEVVVAVPRPSPRGGIESQPSLNDNGLYKL